MTAITVRPIETTEELALQIQLADQAFSTAPSPSNVAYEQEALVTSPMYRPEEVRGAFRDGEQLGGYIIDERKLHMGAAWLTTGCIGSVVTHPAHREQGVARALMQDAIQYALTHKHALLLLDGIPKFYYRFGYTDMFDLSVQHINLAAVLAQPASPYNVRPATVEDAQQVLALYERQYGSYTGSFARTLAEQVHSLQRRSPQNPLLLASDATGETRGYLSLRLHKEELQGREMAVDNWLAALALLQHHAQLLPNPNASTMLHYRLPPTAPLQQWMIDNLEVPDTTMWESPAIEGGVSSQSYHHRYAGWMARIGHLPTLMQQMLPELQARWQRSLANWSGEVSLSVDGETCTFHSDGTKLTLVATSSATTIHFSMQDFVQIIFGYRSVNYVLEKRQQLIADNLLSVLNILFPSGHTWIPSSDWF